MTIKKSLLAVATASTVAIAGTGIASAEDSDALPSAGFSSEGSLDNVDLSDQAAGLFGSLDDDNQFDLGTGITGLAALVTAGAAVAGSITLLPDIYSAVQEFQDFVAEVTGQNAE